MNENNGPNRRFPFKGKLEDNDACARRVGEAETIYERKLEIKIRAWG
jgi:hypothetical protein